MHMHEQTQIWIHMRKYEGVITTLKISMIENFEILNNIYTKNKHISLNPADCSTHTHEITIIIPAILLLKSCKNIAETYACIINN